MAKAVEWQASKWRVHEFDVNGRDGVPLCRCAVLRMPDSLMLWLGGAREPLLGGVALGLPGGEGQAEGALGTQLLGGSGRAAGAEAAAGGLARRLAARLRRPVHVCCGEAFDRLALPLVERGLVAEINRRPEAF